jgi:hypothetical protein
MEIEKKEIKLSETCTALRSPLSPFKYFIGALKFFMDVDLKLVLQEQKAKKEETHKPFFACISNEE